MDSHPPGTFLWNRSGLRWVETASRKIPIRVSAGMAPPCGGSQRFVRSRRRSTRRPRRASVNAAPRVSLTRGPCLGHSARIVFLVPVANAKRASWIPRSIPGPWRAAAMLGLLWAASARASGELSRGDELYARGQLGEARTAYTAALAADPGAFAAMCRLARVESEMAEDLSGEPQRQMIAAAVEHARAAVKTAPDSGVG